MILSAEVITGLFACIMHALNAYMTRRHTSASCIAAGWDLVTNKTARSMHFKPNLKLVCMVKFSTPAC